MRSIDLNRTIRTIVEAEVLRLLTPYQSMLERVSGAFGTDTSQRRPGRLGRGLVEVSRRRGGRNTVRRNGKGDASRFHEGQLVRYKQGRGEFDAKVLRVDAEANRVTIERAMDGKRLHRPAGKLYLGA